MSFELTPQQQEELESTGDTPIRLIVTESNREYVIIPAEVFDRMQAVIDDLTMAQIGDLVERTMAEYDEGDPGLESYQKYRP